jgi:hypothetical protein
MEQTATIPAIQFARPPQLTFIFLLINEQASAWRPGAVVFITFPSRAMLQQEDQASTWACTV